MFPSIEAAVVAVAATSAFRVVSETVWGKMSSNVKEQSSKLLWVFGGVAVSAAAGAAGAYFFLSSSDSESGGKDDNNTYNNKPTFTPQTQGSLVEDDNDGDVSDDDDDDADDDRAVESREQYFELAVEFMNSPMAPKHINTEQLLMLYALYKQAIEGDCDAPRPSMLNMRATAKWDARQEFIGLSCEQARDFYVKLVDHESPDGWQNKLGAHDTERTDASTTYESLKTSNDSKKRASGGDAEFSLGGTSSHAQFSVGISTVEEEQAAWAEGSDVFYLASVGDRDAVLAALGADAGPMINSTDDEGRTLLHWACDRGHLELVKDLIRLGVDLNTKDDDDQTALEYAAVCDNEAVLRVLLHAGANPHVDPDLVDKRVADLIKDILAAK